MTNAQSGEVSLKAGEDRSAYAHSFGPLSNETTYYDPFNKIDLRPELKAAYERGRGIVSKALTAVGGAAGTAGIALIPVYVDPRIVDRTRKFTPWVELIPRVTNQGLTADYNIITTKGAAVSAVEDAPLSDVRDVETRESTEIKYFYSIGRVTGQMQAAMPSYIVQGLQPAGTGITATTFGSPTAPNAKQYEVLKRAQALREKEENTIWTGNTSTVATDYQGIVQLQSTTNQTDKATTAIDWDDVETTVELAYTDSGRPTLAGCDSLTLVNLRKIMVDHFRYSPKEMEGTAGFGVPARVVIETMAGPMPVIPSQYLSTTSGAKQLFFLDMEYIEMRVLQDMTYEDLAKTNDSQKFMLKIYEALIMKAPQFNAFVDNIA